MAEIAPQNAIQCTQCGGELHPDEGQVFLTCPYCSATVYLDKSQVVFHWYLADTLDPEKARAALARWMSGNQTVKDLDKKARLVDESFAYFPLWYFKRRRPDGQEEILVEPAAATSVSELSRLRIPAGDLRKYEPDLDPQAYPPNVPLEAALGWVQEEQVRRAEIEESAMVHIPVYTFKYAYGGETYTALVEGATGQTLANIFPAKAESPFLLVGGLSAAAFLCLATFPVIGVLVNGGEGLSVGLLLCIGLGIPAALALFALGVWVAARV